tara:strand:+ start:403 stop:1377 length:975 start_codon:yes stop_codon:yes gene_type:complete
MKISITSDFPVQKYRLQDLNYKEYEFEIDKHFEIPDGWYELIVDFVDTKIEITDIKINDGSLKHLIYTGFYTDGKGNIHQPATAVWDKGGSFRIWIHTELGVMYQRIMEAIKNGDYGKNLFKDYTLTVDRPLVTKDIWPTHIKSFFKQAHGPQWWPLKHTSTPWMKHDVGEIDKTALLNDLSVFCSYKYVKKTGWEIAMKKNGTSDLPFIEIGDIESEHIQRLLKAVGYKRLIDISVQTLAPNTFIDLHRDDHYKRKMYPYIKGCKKFYWTIENPEGVHFKLGRSGCIPHQDPLLINAIEQPHCVINEGTNTRTSILIYGELSE